MRLTTSLGYKVTPSVVLGDRITTEKGLQVKTDYWYTSINEIRYEAKRAGSHFFDADTMRFFGSRVLPTVYGGRYFITSEQDHYGNGAKAYTIRIALAGGNIDTVGDFQAYATRAQAVSAVKQLLAEGV